jgi:hypothetical protein
MNIEWISYGICLVELLVAPGECNKRPVALIFGEVKINHHSSLHQ